ncbi:phage/plasmid primase, P4 family [Streptomyces sp. NPDC026672]|uniref:phage/plasmid primase, P4 family n=1 Tax=unclassified Streptomyces TaxID=2593676 RepID=UPI0033EF6A21
MADKPAFEIRSPLLQAAFAYARNGWSVFPLHDTTSGRCSCNKDCGKDVGKHPRTMNGHKGATTDSQQIFEWWDKWPDSNIGIATGSSNLFVMDVDTKVYVDKDGIEQRKKGAQTLSTLEAESGQLPSTYTVKTSTGGWHHYFQMPAQRLGCTRGEDGKYLGADIDTRGDGGYVVAPPSVIFGRPYALEVNAPLAPLPEWVVQKLQKPVRVPMTLPVDRRTGEVLEGFQGTPEGLQRYVDKRCQEIRDEPVGGRGEPWVDGIALELSHYAPHQLHTHDLRAALYAAVDTWTDHPEAGRAGVDHGLRHIGTPEHETRVWEERRTPSATDGAEILPPPSNPMATARALMVRWTVQEMPTLRHWNDQWLRWHGSHWVETTGTDLRADIYPALESAHYLQGKTPLPWHPNRRKVADLIEAMQAVAYLSATVQAPSFLPCAGCVQGAVQGAVQGSKCGLTCTVQGVQGTEQKKTPIGAVVACSNGLLDVATRTLHPLTPRFFNFVSVPFDYDPDAPPPQRWLRFLDSVWGDDPDSIRALQDWFGYMVSGRTDLEKILYVQGPTRSGKGTIERTMTALVGEDNRASTTAAKLATDFGLESLIGKSLAVIPDSRVPKENSEIVLERLLSISGGDPVSVSRKYQRDYIGQIPARLVLMSNNLPDFRDPSGALSGRLVILSMTKSFLGQEDTTLKEAIAGEMPGILNWALDGLERVERRGYLTEPASSAAARGITEESSSPLKTWIEDTFTLGSEMVISKKDMYDAYAEWAGAYVMKDTRFFKELYESGLRFAPFRSKRGLFGDGKQTPMFRGIGVEDGCPVCGRPLDPSVPMETGHPCCAVP